MVSVVYWLWLGTSDLKWVRILPYTIHEDSTLGQDINTIVPRSTQEYKWIPGPLLRAASKAASCYMQLQKATG